MRGHALVRPGQWAPTRTVDASLDVLASLDHEVSRRGAYQVYLGSGEHPVRLRVLGRRRHRARAATGWCGSTCPVALPLLPGDRYVLRESGRAETVGGGEVLDVAPVLPASRARPSRSVDRVIAERGWVDVDQLERLTGERRPADVGGRWVVDPEVAGRRPAPSWSTRSTPRPALGLDLAGLTERQRAVLADLDGVVIDVGPGLAGRARRPGPRPTRPGRPPVAGRPARPRRGRRPIPEPPAPTARRCASWSGGAWWSSATAPTSPPRPSTRRRRVVARLLAAAPDGVTVADRPRRPGHQPQVRPAPAGPARRHRRHPAAGRPPHRRAPAAGPAQLSADAGQDAADLGLVAAGTIRDPTGKTAGEAGQAGPFPSVSSRLRASWATATALVMTSPKASGSASSHEWLPATTSPSDPMAAHRASKLARGMIVSLLAPEHHDRQLAALQLLELDGEVGPAGQVGHLPQRQRVAEGVGQASSRMTGSTRLTWRSGSTSSGKWMPQSHSGRSAIERTRLPADDQVEPPTELTRTR